MISQHPKDLDELRNDFAARQSNLLPSDPTRTRIGADDSPLKDNDGTCSTPFVLAVLFLLLAAGLLVVPILRNFEDGTIVAWILACGPLFLSWRFFLSAFQRLKRFGGGPRNDEPN
jgi:hypothetical protein